MGRTRGRYWRSSMDLRRRADRVIPGGTQTFSKGPRQYVAASPGFITHGQGGHVFGVNGLEYIDLVMALGAVTVGYRETRFDGSVYSLPHPLEVELAELYCDIIPCAEMVRFSKNGSDATSGAIRLARAYTGRDIVACCGYHGWHDWYIGSTSMWRGVPQAVRALTQPFKYDNLDGLKQIFDASPGNVAAVILEPVNAPHVNRAPATLKAIRQLCTERGAVLIFDEMVSGMRVAMGGAQEYYGVTPDLTAFGKGIANGAPLSVLAGKREIMMLLEKVFFSFTFGGETSALQAARETQREFVREDGIKKLRQTGAALKDGYNDLVKTWGRDGVTQCIGADAYNTITFSDYKGLDATMMRSIFQQEMFGHGVLTIGGHLPCLAHAAADVERVLDAYDAVLSGMSRWDQTTLRGEPLNPVLRDVVKE